MTDALAITLHALAETTGNETLDVVDLLGESDAWLRTAAALELKLYGAVVGSMSVLLETSPDQSNWREVYTAQVASTDDADDIAIGELDRYLRATVTVAGTTSIFWSLAGTAEVIYCEPSDVGKLAIDEFVLEDFTSEQIVTACISVSGDADDYLDGAFELPLKSWSASLRKNTARLVPAFLMRLRGCDETGADKKVFDAEAKALEWFKAIREGSTPPGIVDSTEDESEGGAVVESEGTARGWGRC